MSTGQHTNEAEQQKPVVSERSGDEEREMEGGRTTPQQHHQHAIAAQGDGEDARGEDSVKENSERERATHKRTAGPQDCVGGTSPSDTATGTTYTSDTGAGAGASTSSSSGSNSTCTRTDTSAGVGTDIHTMTSDQALEDEEYAGLLAVREALASNSFEIPHNELKIMEELGEGFFGKVHKAEFRKTSVAVKKITRSNFREKSDLDLFQKEILIMSKIQNKNCVLFVGVCTDPQNRCIVSEYCAGGNLRELLDKPYLLDPALRLSIARDIAAGLRYLHSWNPPIIHRDLTSNNILLSKNFNAKIADFGLSRERNDAMTTAVGSLSYMAPEAFLGLPYNESVDVYSYGQLLYELVSGNVPHHGMNTQRFAFLVALEDFRQSLAGFTQGMQDLIQGCWQRAPERRPSFDQVCLALEKLAECDFVRDPASSPSSSINQNPTTPANRTPVNKSALRRSNSTNIPSRSNSNVSMASPAQTSDPDDIPPSSPALSPSSPSTNEHRKGLSTSAERDGTFERSEPSTPYTITTVNTAYTQPTGNIVYSNYGAQQEAAKYGYYYESSKSSSSFSYVTDDIDVHVCACLGSKKAEDCSLLSSSTTLSGHSKAVNRLRGDGAQNDFVVSCSEDCTIRVWPITETCKQKQGVLTHSTSCTAVQGVRLGPKLTPFVVSGDSRGDIVLWELRHFKGIRTIKQGHEGVVTNFAWGGTRLVSSGSDSIVKLWDVEKGVCVSSFSGHTKTVNDVHCDSNQVLIVSSSSDGTIKLWDSRIKKDFRTLKVHTGDAVVCAKMRSTGRDNILVSGSNTGQVAVWDMHAPYCITTHSHPLSSSSSSSSSSTPSSPSSPSSPSASSSSSTLSSTLSSTTTTAPPRPPHSKRVCDVDFDNANNLVFAAYADGACSVFETNAWTPAHQCRLRDVDCNSMVFAQHSLVTGFGDGILLVSKIKHES